jgi:hypothetical protein
MAKLAKKSPRVSSRSTQPKSFVFVLMPFDPKFDDIYKFGIKGAADEVGAYAERVDEQTFTEGILDRIFNQISKADVIVADMTGRNPNVFYEVGYAHALGKVVLLLTQNADDIPFDLKHRPHTVYGGKIDSLRTALAPKLEWAMAESRKQQQPSSAERLSIRVFGVDIHSGEASAPLDPDKLPLVRAASRTRSFSLPIHLRNDSLEGVIGITHVYLFCRGDAALVPYENRASYINYVNYGTFQYQLGGAGPQMGPNPVYEPHELDPFTANRIDAPDGLFEQFRMKVNFPAVPPGAVDEAEIPLMFKRDLSSCDAVYRLRLHSARQFHDFRFRIMIDFKPEPKPVKQPGEEPKKPSDE